MSLKGAVSSGGPPSNTYAPVTELRNAQSESQCSRTETRTNPQLQPEILTPSRYLRAQTDRKNKEDTEDLKHTLSQLELTNFMEHRTHIPF